MKDKETARMCLGGLLCGGSLLLSLINLPMPVSGYVNLGDVGVFLGACLLPTPLGAAAVALGACLGDLLLGWAIYIPATALIKFSVTILAAKLQKTGGYRALPLFLLIPLGYGLYEYLFLLGSGVFMNLLGNSLQALLGAVLGIYTGKKLQKKKGTLWNS